MSSSDEDDSSSSPPPLETLNISNDQHYLLRPGQRVKPSNEEWQLDIPRYGSPTIRHSLPAYDLWRPLYPTYLSDEKFRHFHRPKLRHYNTGPQSHKSRKPIPVKSLSRSMYIFQKKLRNKVIKGIRNGMTREAIINKYLLVRDARELTAKQGELFLFEYCEQFPPVLSQVGMASNIKNYISQSLAASNKANSMRAALHQLNSESLNQGHDPRQRLNGNYKIGMDQVVPDHASKRIYFGGLKSGTQMQMIENNMLRAPIYEHCMQGCDFLVVRTRNSIYIRSVPIIFTVGQVMPLQLIPQPTYASIVKFRSDLSNKYIHETLSYKDPPIVNLDNLVKLFPDYPRSILRARLARSGCIRVNDGEYIRGQSKYGSVSRLELRKRYTPEQYCLAMSMLAARQRLRQLNYTETMIMPPNDAEFETEVLAAPWNTSLAINKAMAGKFYLDFKKHLIDPTGSQQEGFSCVSWSKSPTEDQQASDNKESTPPVKAPNQSVVMKNPLHQKIQREKLERLAIYQREAMHLTKIQSDVLSSKEVISSDDEDEGSDEEENNPLDASFDDQLRDLDRLVIGGRSTDELNYEREEEERQKLMQEFIRNEQPSKGGDNQESSVPVDPAVNVAKFKGKILVITRTYDTPDGPTERNEVVTEPKIIALYVKLKGGTCQGSQESAPIQNGTNGVSGDRHSTSFSSTQPINNGSRAKPSRRNSITLGPKELCRANGTILTISKRVLNPRAMRESRRDQRINLSYNG